MTLQPSLKDLYRLRWLLNDVAPGLKSWDLVRIADLYDEADPKVAAEIARQIVLDAEPADEVDHALIQLVRKVAEGNGSGRVLRQWQENPAQGVADY